MKTALPTEIKTIDAAKELLTALFSNNEAFHPEDDATALVGDPFSLSEGQQLNKLMNDIYNLEGNDYPHTMSFDPCEFLLDLEACNTLRKAIDAGLLKESAYTYYTDHFDDDGRGSGEYWELSILNSADGNMGLIIATFQYFSESDMDADIEYAQSLDKELDETF